MLNWSLIEMFISSKRDYGVVIDRKIIIIIIDN